MTATEVFAPSYACEGVSGSSGEAGGGSSSGEGGGSGGGGVVVIAQKQVGPYETVQLKSTDGSALENWLASHGYAIPAADKPVIAAYVKEHFDFLAMKLVPGVGVQAMQPVRVTSKGASVSLPLHMVAVGTGATTGITIWVVAEGRWEPKNFPTFTISDSELVWDWNTYSSNYEAVRLAKESAFGGRGWQIESSIDLNKLLIKSTLYSNIEYGDGEAWVYPADSGGATTAESGIPEAGASSTTSRAPISTFCSRGCRTASSESHACGATSHTPRSAQT
jgi:hypothetical protein